MARQILLHGAYHTRNFGDQLIRSLVTAAVTQNGTANIQTLWPVEKGGNRTASQKLNGLEQLRQTDRAIFGPGGYLHDRGTGYGKKRLLRYAIPAAMLRATQTPYVVVGVGVGPRLSGVGAFQVRELCRGSNGVWVRDEESYQILVDFGVDAELIFKGKDVALAMDSGWLPSAASIIAERLLGEGDHRRLGIHLNAYGSDVQQLTNIIQVCSEQLRGSDVEPILLSDNGPADIATIGRLAAEAGLSPRIIVPDSPWIMAAILQKLDAVFSTKLHVPIVSYALGTTPWAYAVSPKTERFFGQAGIPEYCRQFEDSTDDLAGWISEWVAGDLITQRAANQTSESLKRDGQSTLDAVASFSGFNNL